MQACVRECVCHIPSVNLGVLVREQGCQLIEGQALPPYASWLLCWHSFWLMPHAETAIYISAASAAELVISQYIGAEFTISVCKGGRWVGAVIRLDMLEARQVCRAQPH